MTAAEIQTAIDAGIIQVLEGGQEYQLPNGTRVRRAELASLIKAKGDLTSISGAEDDGCIIETGKVSFGRMT